MHGDAPNEGEGRSEPKLTGARRGRKTVAALHGLINRRGVLGGYVEGAEWLVN